MTPSKLLAALFAMALAVPALAADAPGVFKIPGTQTTLKLNGFVEFDVTYDFDGADDDIRGSDWASFLPFQPLDEGERFKNRLYMTARTSRVGLTTTTPTDHGPLTVRVEGDFNSPSAFNYSTEATTNGTNFRIRHAYGEFAGFLVGQTWSNFMDLGSLPDTVDFNPHGAFALTRSPMIRYATKVGPATLAVALENPQSIVNNAGVSQSFTVGREFDRLPDVTANLTVPFKMGHVNLRGVTLEYQGLTGAVEDSRRGWGLGASGSLKFANETLVWSVQGGDGIGRYMFQSLFQGAAFVGNEIELWRTIAYHVGLTHAWSGTLRSNIAWTQTFFEKDDALAAESASVFGNGAANERIDAFFLNTFVSPAKNLEVGVEYAYGQRTVFASVAPSATNDKGTQHRANALFRYVFF